MIVSYLSACRVKSQCAYILRLAIEAYKRAFPRIQVLGGGYGSGEEGEGTAQDFEACIYCILLATILSLATIAGVIPAAGLAAFPPLLGVRLCVGSVEDGVALICTYRRLVLFSTAGRREQCRHVAHT